MDHSSGVKDLCAAGEDCELSGKTKFYVDVATHPNTDVNLEFRALPFQCILNQVVPPTFIRFGDIMSLAGTDNTRNYFGAEFYLSLLDLQLICQPNKGPNYRNQAYQLQIRIGEQLPGMREMSEVLPQPIIMCINNKLIPTVHIQSPLNVNPIEYLHLNTVNGNAIRGIWPQCDRLFYMVVYLVKIITVDDFVNYIKLDNNRYFSALNTKHTAMKLLENSSKDVSLGAFKLTLLCPINKLRMTLPAKSVNCNHLQCFDLQAFISSNKIEPTWMCPICMNPCSLADLKIDSFLSFIINSINVPKTCEEIELYANGKWKACSLDNDSCEGVFGTSTCHSKLVFEIDLGSSDDEDLGNIEKKVKPIENVRNSNDLKRNICIDPITSTGESDTDEKPPLIKAIKKEVPDT